MADLEHGIEIHELTEAPSLSSGYYIAVDTGSITYKATLEAANRTGSQTAQTAATNAANSAAAAASSATQAQTAAQSVSGALIQATSTLQGYVSSAEASAEAAATSEANARALVTSDYAKTAKSYAVGDTGYREGEDTDNSKYYKEQSANYSVISGSYSTISGNYAAASEESKIYSQTYMNNSKNYSYDSEGWAKGTRNGSNVPNTDPAYNNNSKYYSQRSSEYATQASRNGEAWAVGKRNGVDVPNTDPAYHNNSKWWANTSYQNAEAWADGKRGGVDVPSTDPAYHNNAKWWAEQAEDAVSYGIVDMVGATATTNGKHGAAHEPVAGQENYYWRGDATWSREDMTVTEITDSAPYLYRASKGGDRQYDELIGGSVVFNQLVNTSDTTCTVPNGHKYIFKHNTTYTVAISDGNAFSVDGSANDNVHDITKMFGSTIADYIYAREIAETGSGIAWIKSYGFFSKDYYAYDTGSILSVNTSGHKLEGKNIFNPDTMIQTNYKNGVGVRDGNLYTITVPSGFSNNSGIYLSWASGTKAKYSIFPHLKLTFEYKGNGAFDCGFGMDGTSTTAASATTDWKTFEQTINESSLNTIKFYIKNTVSGAHTLYVKNIMVTTADAENRYVPYVAPITYPLTPTDLRGILSLSGDDLVYDGDVYESDGTCTRNYLEIDLGDCTWEKSSSYDNLFAGSVVNYAYKLQNNVSALCDAYPYVGTVEGPSGASSKGDNTLVLYRNSTNSNRKIYINDSSKWSMTAEQFRQSLVGKKLIVLIATPTTDTLSPFVSPQICDKDGTEEYVDTRAVPMPVGHHTEYYGVPEWLRDRYLDELREYPYNPTLPVNPTTENIANFKNGSMWVKNANLFVKMADNIFRVPTVPTTLKFSSDGAFTLSVATPGWDGTIEYSINGVNWTTWDGSELSGTATQPIYLRGKNNTVITGDYSYKWRFTGKYVTGNIETLLDYETVANGQHPTFAELCYYYMFEGCTSLTTAPSLPATTLTSGCYYYMFVYCSSLITAPSLPATTLADYCYKNMFVGCTSLTTAPSLPATTLAEGCYDSMFEDCTSLKLSTTQDSIYKYAYRIPTSGIGTTATNALTNMFATTGGTFTGTPTINTTYYTDHKPV